MRFEGPDWWRAIVEKYVRFRRLQGARPATIRSYLWALNPLGRHLAAAGLTSLAELDADQLLSWNEALIDQLNESSRALAVQVIRAFIQWSAEEELLSVRLLRAVPRVKWPKREPKPIAERDMKKLLEHYSAPARSLVELRSRALFWVLYQTGARISEALQLDVRDVTSPGRRARIIQKGGGYKTLEWGEASEVAINEYLRARRDHHEALFVTHTTMPAGSGPRKASPRMERIGDQAVQVHWNAIARDLGVERFTSHRLRHTCGTDLYRKTHDVLGVAAKLGHQQLNTTMGYAKVDDSRRTELTSLLDPVKMPQVRPVPLRPLSRRRRPGGGS